MHCGTLTASGLRITVRLTPRGGRDALEGIEALADGREMVKARVRAVPEDGAANAALIGLIAKTLGVAKSHVAIASGHTARVKTLDIAGDGPALQALLLEALKEKGA
ncbi:hypothetical protein IZ6_00870 [Terrihabitans soli]|uniref:UPF0235 protein IZ6_00870 n=1 Tax=Terrihabitans soli TaxID=708113 RepID=A0A6S6QPR3_9HYPH|nr:DUF167 family protein [Terrihabitans soli]BCJ89352.1 hypothetical protein IZ6_00870 [Terrihabitans soli]